MDMTGYEVMMLMVYLVYTAAATQVSSMHLNFVVSWCVKTCGTVCYFLVIQQPTAKFNNTHNFL